MPHVLSGPERQPGRPADRAACIEIGEAHPFFGQLVETRGCDRLLPEASQIPVSQVITHDPDDIRSGGQVPGEDEAGVEEN